MDFGDTVVIQGAGGLGIFATAVASEKGASKVIVIDGQQPRLDLAMRCGATDTVSMVDYPTAESRVERVRELTHGVGADIVVEVVGVAAATLEGLDMVQIQWQVCRHREYQRRQHRVCCAEDHQQPDAMARADALQPVDRRGRASVLGPHQGSDADRERDFAQVSA